MSHPYVQIFSRGDRTYAYLRKPGRPRKRLPGLPGSAAFERAYATALASQPPESKDRPLEVRVLRAIGRKWISTLQLIDAVYDGYDQPFHVGVTISTAVRALMRKHPERVRIPGSRVMCMRRRARRKSR